MFFLSDVLLFPPFTKPSLFKVSNDLHITKFSGQSSCQVTLTFQQISSKLSFLLFETYFYVFLPSWLSVPQSFVGCLTSLKVLTEASVAGHLFCIHTQSHSDLTLLDSNFHLICPKLSGSCFLDCSFPVFSLSSLFSPLEYFYIQDFTFAFSSAQMSFLQTYLWLSPLPHINTCSNIASLEKSFLTNQFKLTITFTLSLTTHFPWFIFLHSIYPLAYYVVYLFIFNFSVHLMEYKIYKTRIF